MTTHFDSEFQQAVAVMVEREVSAAFAQVTLQVEERVRAIELHMVAQDAHTEELRSQIATLTQMSQEALQTSTMALSQVTEQDRIIRMLQTRVEEYYRLVEDVRLRFNQDRQETNAYRVEVNAALRALDMPIPSDDGELPYDAKRRAPAAPDEP